MFKALINKIKEMTTPAPQMSELEEYIISKEPKTPADVEFWIKQFDERSRHISRSMNNGDIPMANWYRKHF